MDEAPSTTRLDKWLWAVRLFKTRALATDACRRGQIRIAGNKAKPSRPISTGQTIEIRYPTITKTVKVLAALDKRVGAKLVPTYLQDLTPQNEIERASRIRQENRLNRVFDVPGQGRPDKRQLREMKKFLDAQDQD